MHWRDDYQQKRSTAQEAARLIHSGDRVFTSGNVATPRRLLRALIDIAHPGFRAELERAAWQRHLL